MSLSNTDRQDLRHACLRAIAKRPLIMFTAGQVSAFVHRLVPFSYAMDDIREALEFLAGVKHAEKVNDPYGSEHLYKVTAEGTLANERSETA